MPERIAPEQTRNQIGTLGGTKSFLRGAQIFKLCPLVLNYVQRIFQGAKKVSVHKPLQKVITNFYEVAGHVWVDLNWSHEPFPQDASMSYETQGSRTQAYNQDKLTDPQFLMLLLSQTFCYWGKQQSVDRNIIQFYLTVKCAIDQSSHFCHCFV